MLERFLWLCVGISMGLAILFVISGADSVKFIGLQQFNYPKDYDHYNVVSGDDGIAVSFEIYQHTYPNTLVIQINKLDKLPSKWHVVGVVGYAYDGGWHVIPQESNHSPIYSADDNKIYCYKFNDKIRYRIDILLHDDGGRHSYNDMIRLSKAIRIREILDIEMRN